MQGQARTRGLIADVPRVVGFHLPGNGRARLGVAWPPNVQKPLGGCPQARAPRLAREDRGTTASRLCTRGGGTTVSWDALRGLGSSFECIDRPSARLTRPKRPSCRAVAPPRGHLQPAGSPPGWMAWGIECTALHLHRSVVHSLDLGGRESAAVRHATGNPPFQGDSGERHRPSHAPPTLRASG